MDRRRRRWITGLLTTLLVALGGAGCEPGTGPSATGEIRGMVEIDGTPVANVSVQLSGPTDQVAVTDSEGEFRFSTLDPGAYVLTLQNIPNDATFPATSRTAIVPRTGEAVISFSGHFVRTAAIAGKVSSGLRPLSGVEVELRGREARVAVTDGEGRFRFTGLRSGDYEVELVGAPQGVDFASRRRDVFLAAGELREIDFAGEPAQRASIAIQSVLQEVNSSDLVPADPQNIHGVIRVLVAVAPGTESLINAELFVGDELVVRQIFGSTTTSSSLVPAGQDAELLLILMTVDTQEVDPATGAPRFPNGTTELAVNLSTRESGPNAYRSSVSIFIRN